MTVSRRWMALAIVIVGGVAACGVATPTPPASVPVPQAASATPATPPAGVPTPSATVAADPKRGLVDLGLLLRADTVDATFTSRILEFASTGFDVIASAAERPGDDAAPDLYRIPSDTGVPELAWRNPDRDHSLVRLAADGDTIAFVDMPITGEKAWTLWLIPDAGAEPIALDELDPDPEVPSLVPSVSVYHPFVAWTSFARGPSGPVSRLMYATAPDWEPTLFLERPSAAAELWFPSLYGSQVAYTELVYSADRTSDERRVWLTHLGAAEDAVRLDTSGLATMPVVNQFGVAWKEGQAGFHQLNWGSMERYDADAGRPAPMWADDYVNYPSVGTRYTTWWVERLDRLTVWDGSAGEPRDIAAYDDPDRRIHRQHVAGSLIVWLEVDDSGSVPSNVLRYALLPGP